MGYRVVTSGAFAGGQGVFDRFQTPCNEVNIRVYNQSNVLIIVLLKNVDLCVAFLDFVNESSFGRCTEVPQNWSASKKVSL